MKTVFALLTALMALGCLPKDQGAPLAQALVEAPIVAPSPRPPLAIEPSVARVMPDQLATTAAMTFSMDERDLDRVAVVGVVLLEDGAHLSLPLLRSGNLRLEALRGHGCALHRDWHGWRNCWAPIPCLHLCQMHG